MKLYLCLLAFLALALAGCGDDDKPAAGGGDSSPAAPAVIDQSSPQAVAEGIFAAARSGNFAPLAAILDPEDSDGDAKQVANVAQAPADKQAEFRKFFEKGKVSGDVTIEGAKAAVPILFGPEGTKKETLNMVKRAERWYLSSF